jgi:hypothetical protein
VTYAGRRLRASVLSTEPDAVALQTEHEARQDRDAVCCLLSGFRPDPGRVSEIRTNPGQAIRCAVRDDRCVEARLAFRIRCRHEGLR